MQPGDKTGQPQGYPPQQQGYPPQQYTGYPPQQYGPQGYPPQQAGYPPQQPGYPPQQLGYPPQQAAYPPQQQGYPAPGSAVTPAQAPAPSLFESLGKPMGYDPESQANMAFADKKVRAGFIRKVFAILTLQLAITVAFAAYCFKTQAIKTYVAQNRWIFWLAWGLAFVIILVISFSGRARRTHPYNLLLLGLFTACQAFLVGINVSRYDSRVVLLAFMVTGLTVFAATLFACQTKWDITSKGGILFILLIVLIVLSIVGAFWVNTIFHLVIAGFGAILFTFYLIHDVQMIMGGRVHQLSPDEYVFGALTVYIDIINMFQYILAILGIISND